MSAITNNNVPFPQVVETHRASTQRNEKITRIAISILIGLGAIFSYVLGFPGLLTIGLFALALLPLFPLGQVSNDQRGRYPFPSPIPNFW